MKVMSNECYSILSGRPLTLHEHPLRLASRGWSSPAILPPQDWTENLTVNSPTLQPLNHVVDEISCQNVSIYAQGILNYQGNSKIQNFKIYKDQELNSGSSGCLCHQTPYPTRLSVHIQEQQIWKYKLERASSWYFFFSQKIFRFELGTRIFFYWLSKKFQEDFKHIFKVWEFVVKYFEGW